jgi:hypothetical protein
MSKDSKNSKQNKQYLKSSDNLTHTSNKKLLLLPIIIILAILPLIVKSYVYDPNLSKFSWFSNEDHHADFFLYYKQLVLIITSSIMLIILVLNFIKDKTLYKKSKLFIPLLVYALLTIASTVLSKHSSYGYSGVFEQFESLFAILGYCIIAYYSYMIITSEEDIKYIMKFFLIGIVVICILGLTQILGFDFFSTNLGRHLIISRKYWDNADSMDFIFGPNRVYLSLYNPNYVGVYVALIVPIIISLILFAKGVKAHIKYILIFIGLFISLLGSQSRSGFIGIIASLILFIIFLRKYLLTKIKIIIPILISSILLLIIINFSTDNLIFNRFMDVFDFNKDVKPLSKILTNDDNVSVVYNDNILNITFLTENGQFNSFILTDGNNQPVNYTQEINSYLFNISDERFPNFVIEPIIYGEILSFRVNIDNHDWIFTNQTTDQTYYFINNYNKVTKIQNIDSSLLRGYEIYGSGRGYIWSRTFPLLKDKIILGSGAESFVFEFPQEDYVGLYNNGFSGELLTKPHNLYLQIATQSGILSLIAFVIFYLIYLVSSLRLYFKATFKDYMSQIGLGIFIGTFSYMICGITNDSNISVSPIFWILLGTGFAINKIIREDNKIANQ